MYGHSAEQVPSNNTKKSHKNVLGKCRKYSKKRGAIWTSAGNALHFKKNSCMCRKMLRVILTYVY